MKSKGVYEVRSKKKVRHGGKKKKYHEENERDGSAWAWFWECEPCWNHSLQISTMCPPEPYYPINELYWGNKVLWSSAKTLKGPCLSRPGARSRPIPQGTNEKRRAPWPRVHCPQCSLTSLAGWYYLSNGLLQIQKWLVITPRRQKRHRLLEWPDLWN